jgi:hypothetical protein
MRPFGRETKRQKYSSSFIAQISYTDKRSAKAPAFLCSRPCFGLIAIGKRERSAFENEDDEGRKKMLRLLPTD